MERNTTERFFIVKEDTPFFRQFVAYEEFVDKSCKVFSAFAEQTGMDRRTVCGGTAGDPGGKDPGDIPLREPGGR